MEVSCRGLNSNHLFISELCVFCRYTIAQNLSLSCVSFVVLIMCNRENYYCDVIEATFLFQQYILFNFYVKIALNLHTTNTIFIGEMSVRKTGCLNKKGLFIIKKIR